MNNKIKKIEDVLNNYGEKYLNGLGDITSDSEIPNILQQYIMYEAIWAWVWFAVISIGLPLLTHKLISNISNEISKKDTLDGLLVKIFNLSYVLMILIGLKHLSIAIKATFLPNLFIIQEYLNNI